MPKLHISAGGKGERIRSYLNNNFDSPIPKHLLPIPSKNSTILEEIVQNAEGFFDEIVIWVGTYNFSSIEKVFKNNPKIKVILDEDMTGPLGPIIRELLLSREVVYSCAGDFYCEFDWNIFNNFHIKSNSSVSILVSQSVGGPSGAVFSLEQGKIASWERVPSTVNEDLINIGCYIISPTDFLINLLANLRTHKEDNFFDALIPLGIVFGYNPGITGYNINTPEVYEALISYLSRSK
jgi:NDP-sugar pyrophosphorylase family protein